MRSVFKFIDMLCHVCGYMVVIMWVLGTLGLGDFVLTFK